MIPIGYMFKQVLSRPDWLKAPSVADICSASNCLSPAFADYIGFWAHNGYWLFDTPATMETLAAREGIDLSTASLFYYEAFEEEYNEERKSWSPFAPDAAFITDVAPTGKRLLGYDVATFSTGNAPECWPLSCNGLAEQVAVNRHCLFSTFDDAKRALEYGVLDKSEPGPFRILAVYAMDRS